VITQFLLVAISRSPAVSSAAPQLFVIVIVADVVSERSTKFVKISTSSGAPSWQLAKPTVLANTIWQRSRELLFTEKLAPKSVPEVVVMLAVERAGMECKDGQFDNIVLILVADAVLNSGIDCRLSQDANIDDNVDNDDVKLNNGTVINDLQFEKVRLAVTTEEKSNNGTFFNDTHDSNILSVVVTSDVSNKVIT
jgi:hypothetical protein